jgi:taurine dioxygenase
MLRCVECPQVGGDTLFINMVAAYENLPDDIKTRLDGLIAVHDILPTFGNDVTPERGEELRRQFPAQHHPVVRTHPESGEKILYVNQAFTTHILNFESFRKFRFGFDYQFEEMNLLQYLYTQAAAPEYQVRLKWRPNTIAFWDNRATQHYAIQDYFPATRRMMRATVIGDKPF